MSLRQTIDDFVALSITLGRFEPLDHLYVQNRILALIGDLALPEDDEYQEGNQKHASKGANQDYSDFAQETKEELKTLKSSSIVLLDQLIDRAIENGTISDGISERDILRGQLMDLVTPTPSQVNHLFNDAYQKDPKLATQYFYDLCLTNDYIKKDAIAKNEAFTVTTDYGDLEITINLSKPEKDPKAIALARQTEKPSYPKCMLCFENEGYQGRLGYPARSNHRIIRFPLLNETWGFQYSPYAYYDEHSIFISDTHRPMQVSQQTFERLLAITDWLPHYFVGSNADLPIVGGSILSHDHYQGGNHHFAMEKAEIETPFTLSAYPTLTCGIVKWPMSVIRLNGADKEELIAAATFILDEWRQYSDLSVSVSAHSADGTPHHTITPIARRKGERYELDLVLRDNNTSDEFPDGIFHPHPELHHIKKENIGLIEVMGLAILPPRLKDELKVVSRYLLEQDNQIADYHKNWATGIKTHYAQKNEPITSENVNHIVQEAVGEVFKNVLLDAGVFKRTSEGQTAFKHFIASLNA